MKKFGNDEDMRIAPDDLSKLFSQENPVADDNIDLFIRQRSLGNTDKARALGRQLVEDLLDCVWTAPPEGVDAEEFELQLTLLFAYTVHRIVEDYSPNSIVANTAVSTFYERLEDAAPKAFEAINKRGAFSLYLYLHRQEVENAKTVGATFAKLCSCGSDSECAAVGEFSYARFVGACAQKMVDAGYQL